MPNGWMSRILCFLVGLVISSGSYLYTHGSRLAVLETEVGGQQEQLRQISGKLDMLLMQKIGLPKPADVKPAKECACKPACDCAGDCKCAKLTTKSCGCDQCEKDCTCNRVCNCGKACECKDCLGKKAKPPDAPGGPPGPPVDPRIRGCP